MPSRRVLAGLATACLAVVTAGCGSSGSSTAGATVQPTPTPTTSPLTATAYRLHLHQVAQEENAAQHRVEQAFHAHSVAQVRADLTTFAADQRQAAQQLAALTPPADASAANADLAQAFNDNAGAIQTLLTRLPGAKTVKQALAMVQRDQAAQRVGQEIDSALAKLKKLGYTSGS
jgi:hypothetical protein